jgi:hypothetical protein
MKAWLFFAWIGIIILYLGIGLIDQPKVRDINHRLLALESASDSSAEERVIFTTVDTGDTVSIPRSFFERMMYEQRMAEDTTWHIYDPADLYMGWWVNESPLEKARKK